MNRKTQTMTERLAEFVTELTYEQIPEHVIETQKKSVLDALGITYGALPLGNGCQAMIGLAEECAAGGREEAVVIGTGKRLPVVWSAFANASMAHSLDFGDTQMHAVVHSNASTFPAALAAAEKKGGISGSEFLTALIAGSEVACRIALGVHEDLEAKGFYMPPIYTSFGATAAAGKILGLSKEALANAFSFNLCQTTCSAELMNHTDTDVRSIREAFAAKNALLSTGMAQRGIKGFPEPLQGKYGFYHAYAGCHGDEESALAGLGEKFEAGDLYFKLWPSCAGTHPVIRILKELTEAYHFDSERIQEVHVVTSLRNRMLMEPLKGKRQPESAIVAKFSIPYTGALAVLKQSVALGDFSEEPLKNPEVLKLASKFTYEVNEHWGKEEGMNTEIAVHLQDGTIYYGEYKENGAVQPEPSWKEMEDKYLLTADYNQNRTQEDYRRTAELVRTLETLEDIRILTAGL